MCDSKLVPMRVNIPDHLRLDARIATVTENLTMSQLFTAALAAWLDEWKHEQDERRLLEDY